MSRDLTRYALVLEILQGDADAYQVLADLMEEQGQRGLAHWSRNANKSPVKRLDFVLAVLPYRTALLLGCDFLEHGLGLIRETDMLIGGVRRIGDWARGTASTEELDTGCQMVSSVGPWAYGIADLDRTMQSLHAAARCAASADYASMQGDGGSFRTHSEAVSNGVRRVARASRMMAQPTWRNRQRPNFGDPRSQKPADELAWQMAHLQAVVDGKLTGKSGPPAIDYDDGPELNFPF